MNFREIQQILKENKRLVLHSGELIAVEAESTHSSALQENSEICNSPDMWETYNFEVEGLHTYIAGGYRVHNKSVNSYVPTDSIVIEVVKDKNGIPRDVKYIRKDGVIVFLDGTNDQNGNTIKVKETITYPGSPEFVDGATVTQIVKYANGKEISREIDSFVYDGTKIQLGTIGNILGSQIGAVLGGNSLVGQVGAATVIGTFTQSIGDIIQTNYKLSHSIFDTGDNLQTAIDATFKQFGTNLVNNLANQITGQISSLLMTELADALDLDGFERGLFTSVSTTITNQLLTNVKDMIIPRKGVEPSLFNGFAPEQLFGQVAGAVGGYLGSYLASQVVMPDNSQASIGTSIGSSLGAYIGSFLPIPIPGVGTFIGAFLGNIFGTALGNAFGVDEKAWGSVYIDTNSGKAVTGNFGSDNGGDFNTFTNITNSQATLVNGIVEMIGADIVGLKPNGSGSVGYWQKGKTYTVYMPDGSAYDFLSRITADPEAAWPKVSDDGVMQLLKNAKVKAAGRLNNGPSTRRRPGMSARF